MLKRLRLSFPPEKKLAARRAYEKGAPQAEVAAILGCSQGTVHRRILEWGWEPERAPRPYRRRPRFRFIGEEQGQPEGRYGEEIPPYGLGPERFELAESKRFQTVEPPSDDLAVQIEQLVARETRRVRTCGGAAPDVARTLASLAQTLKTLRTLPVQEEEAQGGDDLDFDAEEYRAEIARRLDEIAGRESEIAFVAGSTDGGSI